MPVFLYIRLVCLFCSFNLCDAVILGGIRLRHDPVSVDIHYISAVQILLCDLSAGFIIQFSLWYRSGKRILSCQIDENAVPVFFF